MSVRVCPPLVITQPQVQHALGVMREACMDCMAALRASALAGPWPSARL
jgi:acetylornithine/succinyldiaminopimelate/putrescine aminotransferase